MKHKYKLKMTVDGAEHLADVSFNCALDSVFNKRKIRIQDYYGNPNSSIGTKYLSEYITNGIGITSENNVPLIPVETNFSWKGYRNTNYTNLSGNIGKVHLLSENVISKDYSQDNPNLVSGKEINFDYYIDRQNYHIYVPMSLDQEDGETIVCRDNKVNNIGYDLKFARLKFNNDLYWGLDGINDTGRNYRTEKTLTIRESDIKHNYANPNITPLDFDTDVQYEDTVIGGKVIEYTTWNMLVDYGTAPVSVSHDENYIYVFETFLSNYLHPIRIGQYNKPATPYSDYPFKPQNCSYYYNETTKEFERPDGATAPIPVTLNMLVNYIVINKKTLEIVQQNSIVLDNVFSTDLSDYRPYQEEFLLNGLGSGKFIIKKPYNGSIDNLMMQNKLPALLSVYTADDNYVYLFGCFNNQCSAVWRLSKASLTSEIVPTHLLLEMANINDVADFCHTINIRNLYSENSSWADSNGNRFENGLHFSNGQAALINKANGIMNWTGYIDCLKSGEADFGGVQVSSGQTVKFELIEVIENEG